MAKKRTIVVSDVHGFPELVENALVRFGFDPVCDGLVFAGDFLDRGPEPDRCLEVLESAGAVMLVGNHDEGILLDRWVPGTTADSRRFRPTLIEHVLDDASDARWCLAHAVDGVLVTHAGVSALWQREFDEECGGDAALLARLLNDEFVTACRAAFETGDFAGDRVLGEDGPLWWRFWERGRTPPLDGCVQVFGHTPVKMLAHSDSSLQRMDLFAVDPFVYGYDAGNRPPAGRCKYAVIEGGDVRIVDVAGAPP